MTHQTLDDLLRAADPSTEPPRRPDVRDEVRAALAWHSAHADRLADAGRGVPVDHRPRRRRIVAAVAAAGIAAAVAVAVPVLLPSGTPGSASDASARALHHLADATRTAAAPGLRRTTTRTRELGTTDTTAGPAYYRQFSTVTQMHTATGDDRTYVWRRPHWLTR